MAVNIGLEKLEQGKALCGRNFPGFVKTFNWLVDFCRNLKGDADVDALNGRVTVDTADEAHPIIRFNAAGFSTGGSGSGSGGGSGGGGGGGGGGDEDDCVTSLNETTGDMDVIGGEYIRVETDGQTIKISYDAEKTEEDEDPNKGVDPCDHDATGGAGGGVAVDGAGGDGGGAGGGSSEGGVVAGGEVHPGSGCNTCG